jgi:hypothetical protein
LRERELGNYSYLELFLISFFAFNLNPRESNGKRPDS